MHEADSISAKGLVAAWLKDQIGFHHKWRRLMMNAYVITTVMTVAGSALATIFAAREMSAWAACRLLPRLRPRLAESSIAREEISRWKSRRAAGPGSNRRGAQGRRASSSL
ncbi:MAG: hypothetical protein ABSH28_00555 [Acidobacteriota bacterium]